MVTTHNLGFPRIGARRELKFALENYWNGASSILELQQKAADLRKRHWQQQTELDLVPVGDFSFYDQVLDMSFTLGNVPERANKRGGHQLDKYFRVARGRAAADGDCNCANAGKMTKWFDTNYHYTVPEFTADTAFSLNPEYLLSQVNEAQQQGVKTKPVMVGPVTYLWLGKAKDRINKLDLLDRLLPVYVALLERLAQQGIEWVQIDEPILTTELDRNWKNAFCLAYDALKASPIKLLLATYFGELQDNLQTACRLPIQGLHIDAINAHAEIGKVIDWLPSHKVLSLGVINGRNIWKRAIHLM